MSQSTVLPAADRLPLRLDDGEAGYRLVRAWPRSPEHMLVEVHPDGQESVTVAGQWFADPATLAQMARTTPAPARRVGPVLLQPDGADAQLPALAEVLAEPGAQLIGHRPGRRAVVRVPGLRLEGDVFVKVVRKARRAEDVVRRGQLMRALVGTEVVVPELVEADLSRGVVRWSDVGGRTLSDLGHSWSSEEAYDAWKRAGRAIALLHAADPELVEDRHDDDAEVAGADRWLGPAIAHGRLDPETVARAREQVVAALADLPGGPAVGVLHRDLHDRQVLLRPDGRIGLIDVDTLAVGERAVDLANVLVHLELRQAQGQLVPEAAAGAWEGLRAGLHTGATERGEQEVLARALERLPAYVLACRLRMAAIYSFRPRWHHLARALLDAVVEGRGPEARRVRSSGHTGLTSERKASP